MTPGKNYLAIGCITLLFTAIFFIFWGAIVNLAYICWNQGEYSHGLLLPPLTLYLIYARWERIHRAGTLRPKPLWMWLLGIGCITAGMLGYALGEGAHSFYLGWVGLFFALAGAILLSFDRALTSVVLGPVLLMFMAKPIPDSLVPRLFNPFQVLAAKSSAYVLELFSIPVHVVGNVIEIPGMQLMVEEACSGMRSLMALLTVSFVVLSFIELRVFLRPIFVGIAIVLAVVLNIVRVAATGLMAHYFGEQAATGSIHEFSGLVTFVIGLVCLSWAGRVLERLSTRSV